MGEIEMGDWRMTGEGWRHAPWWKVAINTPLRLLQWGRPLVWLVYSRVDMSTHPPTVISYGFGRVAMLYNEGEADG